MQPSFLAPSRCETSVAARNGERRPYSQALRHQRQFTLLFFGEQRLGTEALNPQTGSLLPAVAREASYTFEQEGVFCGATYHGMWLNGQPHGQ